MFEDIVTASVVFKEFVDENRLRILQKSNIIVTDKKLGLMLQQVLAGLNITVTVNGTNGSFLCWFRAISNSMGRSAQPDPHLDENTKTFCSM